MGQGSQEEIRMQSSNWKEFRTLQAFRMAVTSAWAVGSPEPRTSLQPSATNSLWRMITAANGPPFPLATFSSDKALTRSNQGFNSSMLGELAETDIGPKMGNCARIQNQPCKSRFLLHLLATVGRGRWVLFSWLNPISIRVNYKGCDEN